MRASQNSQISEHNRGERLTSLMRDWHDICIDVVKKQRRNYLFSEQLIFILIILMSHHNIFFLFALTSYISQIFGKCGEEINASM